VVTRSAQARRSAENAVGKGLDRRDAITTNVRDWDITFGGVANDIDKVLGDLVHGAPETYTPAPLNDVCHLAAILETADLEAAPSAAKPLFTLSVNNGQFVLKFEQKLEQAGRQSMSDSEWAGLSRPQSFLAAVSQMCGRHRKPPTSETGYPPVDTLALERGVQLVERGILPPRAFAPIQTSDLRPAFQTYLSLADPGPGHLEVTTRRQDLLEGTMVHIEYIDRGKITDKSKTEAYRIPSIRHVARIRLVVGDATPCTVYIGRPVFESRRFENDVLKSAHTIAAACSAMFGLGIADCKIAMDGMTASESVLFMEAVAGNTIRDTATQRLSAAFNLNSPLTDDRDKAHQPKIVTDRLEIARLSIKLASSSSGRFDKVTWDGASDGASLPLIPNQLSPLELFGLVHEAHSRGLETYISAGMDAGNMGSVTEVGVGGVGIGTKLHFRDTGAIGRINDQEVAKVLANRNFAALRPPAQAASLLARLDWLYFEIHQTKAFASLRKQVGELRTSLFQGLESYWQSPNESDRISMHPVIKQLLEAARRDWVKLVEGISPQHTPAAVRPELRTLSAGEATLGIADLLVHPLKHKAMLFVAAARREEELRRSGAPQLDAPLISPERVRELEALIAANDLVGIQAWFLN